MTKSTTSRSGTSPSGSRCRWCARPLESTPGAGRPKVYCRQTCRQQAYLARRLAETHGLGPDDVVVRRGELEDLLGHLYCLQAAVEDVDRDLAESTSAGAVKEALDWLLANARPLCDSWLEPKMAEEALSG